MGLILDETRADRALRGAEAVAHDRDVAAYEAAYLDDDRLPAEVLAAMLTECMRSGSLLTRLPVPGWRDAFSRLHGPATVAVIVGEEVGADDALMDRVLAVLCRAMSVDADARALVAEIAAKYGRFHGSEA